jgi:hypothetical protein
MPAEEIKREENADDGKVTVDEPTEPVLNPEDEDLEEDASS